MNIDLESELLLEGVARGVERALAAAGFVGQLRDLLFIVEKLTLLKQGLLTADQSADLLQVARRTFDRWVAEGSFRKETALGEQAPRFWLLDLIEKLQPGHLQARGDAAEPAPPAALPVVNTNLLDLFPASVAAGTTTRARRPKVAKNA